MVKDWDKAAIFYVWVGEPDIDNPEHRAINMRRFLDLKNALGELAETRPIGSRIALIKRRKEFREYGIPKEIALAASADRVPLIFVNVTYKPSGFDVAELAELERRFDLVYAGEVDTSNHFAKKR
jgi:hypothetical protein